MNVTTEPAAASVPATEMFPAAVHVKPEPEPVKSSVTVHEPLPPHPTGTLIVTSAVVPVNCDSGPDGVIVAPVTDADALTGFPERPGFPKPGIQVFETVEQSHCAPVRVLMSGRAGT